MKQLILKQSNDEFSTSHSGLALIGACINRYSDLGRQVGALSPDQRPDRRNRHPAQPSGAKTGDSIHEGQANCKC